ncbi:polysaccharide deacetylase family protein [Deinococcus hopiensis]|uniref:Peptidoglycan/xylan/chitin deacetylase, PgdA/CDA1 family n=1 Tax=Deinococcus hopiensis KR-140 TaxID=695939 RepID=A0A1W1UIB1_9DEIO|nr:polysaccharide deacetylase family protein [Deinococcus hopiensis]SMB80504.1 Peptidoglycan/xylan/chitin deacetylase, PgdA/CDA1 family [Deinococcus hopiensis KR-140]
MTYRRRTAPLAALCLFLTASLSACANDPGLNQGPSQNAAAAADTLGAFQLTLGNPASGSLSAQGLHPQAKLKPIFPVDTVDVQSSRSGVYDDDLANRRYLWISFDLTNVSKTTFSNLSLIAYAPAQGSVAGTAISGLINPQGQPYTNSIVARNIRPGEWLKTAPTEFSSFGFTALTEDEAQRLEDKGRQKGLLERGDDVLEYGFNVLNSATGSQVLRPGEKGTLTLVVKLPLVDENTPREFSMNLLLSQSNRERVTRLVGETTASAAARAASTGAEELALIGDLDKDRAPGGLKTVRIPNVRLTTGAKPVYLVDNEPEPQGCLGGVTPNSLGAQATATSPGPMITFITDDASKADKTKLLPLFKAKGIVATSAVISGQMTNPDPYFLGLEGVRELKQAGWEIVSHTVSHPDMTTLSDEDLLREVRDSKKELALFGFNTDTLVYPYGQQDARVRAVVCKYFRHGVLAWGEGNTLPLTTNYQIGRYALGAYANGTWGTLDFYKATVDQAVKNKDWLVFMIHPGDELHTDQQQEYLSQTIDYIKGKGVPVVTMGEALRRMGR